MLKHVSWGARRLVLQADREAWQRTVCAFIYGAFQALDNAMLSDWSVWGAWR